MKGTDVHLTRDRHQSSTDNFPILSMHMHIAYPFMWVARIFPSLWFCLPSCSHLGFILFKLLLSCSMTPIKTKGRKMKGLSTPLSLKKITQKAGSRIWPLQPRTPPLSTQGLLLFRMMSTSSWTPSSGRSRSYPRQRHREGVEGDEDKAVSTISVTVA